MQAAPERAAGCRLGKASHSDKTGGPGSAGKGLAESENALPGDRCHSVSCR